MFSHVVILVKVTGYCQDGKQYHGYDAQPHQIAVTAVIHTYCFVDQEHLDQNIRHYYQQCQRISEVYRQSVYMEYIKQSTENVLNKKPAYPAKESLDHITCILDLMLPREPDKQPVGRGQSFYIIEDGTGRIVYRQAGAVACKGDKRIFCFNKNA